MSGPLFKPFRALGYITEDVPFAVQRRGKDTYAVVSVGRTWQVRGIGTAEMAQAATAPLQQQQRRLPRLLYLQLHSYLHMPA
jgi:hypothetical protein